MLLALAFPHGVHELMFVSYNSTYVRAARSALTKKCVQLE